MASSLCIIRPCLRRRTEPTTPSQLNSLSLVVFPPPSRRRHSNSEPVLSPEAGHTYRPENQASNSAETWANA
ncbi:hypothetical protein XA68_10308 [Ophiocordyceps unilateralis]|uniref:Uncharacterized protein n=1 Tax=Ophiocordyceps unilateralis TaxID=268505 RepID=A0A2A9PHU4_OPHUN|nr:hypothetical protein XA68_10308 [Ophiocordyceps unilateralis]